MKTRNGFVSNSSSTSFIIIGYELDFVKKMEYDKLKNKNKGMIVILDEYDDDPDDIYLGKMISEHNEQSGVNTNPDHVIDWQDIKAIEDEGRKLNLGKPRLHSFKIGI